MAELDKGSKEYTRHMFYVKKILRNFVSRKLPRIQYYQLETIQLSWKMQFDKNEKKKITPYICERRTFTRVARKCKFRQ